MADNSEAILAIRTLLGTGTRSVTVDGVTTTFDPDSLRKELSRLLADDDTEQTKRPRAFGVNLSGF